MTDEEHEAYRAACQAGETRMRARGAVDWDQAKPGDLLLSGLYMVRRRIRTRREAAQLATEGPGRQVYIDGPRLFAVVERRTP